MHPDFEKYRAPADNSEQMNVRLPKELAARVRILATLEGDSLTGMMTEAIARLVEAREEEPVASQELVQQRVDTLMAELDVLSTLQKE